jgi:hypothetical protein
VLVKGRDVEVIRNIIDPARFSLTERSHG